MSSKATLKNDIRSFPCAQEKTYYIYEEDGEPMLHRAEGTKIEWAAGKNPTVKVIYI